MLKTIFFDLDGLILDSEKVYFKYWVEAGKRLGYNISEDVYLGLRSCDKQLAQKIVTEATGDSNAYFSIRNKRKELMNDYLKNNLFEIKPGVREFLEKLKLNIRAERVIVTSSFSDEKRKSLVENGILELFTHIVSCIDVGKGKPYPDIYDFACKKTDTKKEDCIAFEDSPNGVISAYEAGIKVIMIPDLSTPEEKIVKKCKVFKNIEDSYPFIEKIQ